MRRLLSVTILVAMLTGCSGAEKKSADEQTEAYVPATPVTQTAPAAELAKTADATFADDVLNSKEPVFLDFNTSWCVPCKAMEPILRDLAAEHKGKVKFLSIDAEKNPIAAAKYSVTAYPTFCIVKNGKTEATAIGAKSKLDIESLLISSHAL